MRTQDIAVAGLLGLAAATLVAVQARAQSWSDLETESSAPTGSEATQFVDPDAVSGPTIYVVDKLRQLSRINLGTKAVHIVGTMSQTLTDIGFDPTTHNLYGINFKSLFAVDKNTAALQRIGALGVSDANALVFNSHGTAYAAGVNTGELYTIDITTGRATAVGSTEGYESAGDLTFYNDHLLLAAFQDGEHIGRTTPNYLVTLNPKTGEHEGKAISIPIFEVFGLVSTGKNELYGLALDGKDAGLYQLFPSRANYASRAQLLEDLSTRGLGQILGAAYDGNYQP